MGLFDFLRRGNRQLGFANAVNSSLTHIGNQEVYTHIDTARAIDKGYNGNTAVYAILNKDGAKFGSIPSYVYKKGDESKEKLENDLSKLINRPNDDEGQDAFRMKLRIYYKLCGECFVWLNRGKLTDDDGVDLDDKARSKKPILEMIVLPTDFVKVVPDTDNLWGIKGYCLDILGSKTYINKADVIHWKNVSLLFDPSTREHLRGVSPLSAGYKSLQQNNSATDAAVRMYQNDGAKGIIFNETFDKLTPEQKAQIKSVIDAKINSNDVKGTIATLQGIWKYIDLGKSNTDLALLEGKDNSMKDLCFLFDMPYELFDSETTFANKKEAQKGWITNSIGPACKQWDDECNRMLLPAFGLETTAYIASDVSELPEMQQDMAALATYLNQAWWITGDEKREAMGHEPTNLPYMNEPVLPSGYEPLSLLGENMDQIASRVSELDEDDE